MLIRNLLAAGLAALAVGGGDASAANIKCNGCTEAAYQVVAQQRGVGTHLVYDLIHNRAASFDVHWDGERRAWEVEPTATDQEAAELVDMLSEFYEVTGGSMQETYSVDASSLGLMGLGGASAYDLVDDPMLQTRLTDYFLDTLPTGTASQALRRLFGALYSGVLSHYGLADGSVVIIKLVFTDGSTAKFQVDLGQPVTVTYVERSARNSENQPLLEANSENFRGRFYFGGENALHQFLQRAAQLGIPVVGGGSTVSCTWDGHTLTCKRV